MEMIPLGYQAKRVLDRPEWLDVEGVRDIYSVSGCMSDDFCDYVSHWRHNGYWFFNSPADIKSLASEVSINLDDHVLVFYCGYEKQYNAELGRWTSFEAIAEFPTQIIEPKQSELMGYDVVTYWAQNAPEHSPLSCNHMAGEIPVNEHCLVDTAETLVELLESGQFDKSEPGPYRVIEVHRVAWNSLNGMPA